MKSIVHSLPVSAFPGVEASSHRSLTWARRFLCLAAAWNILGGISALLAPAPHFAQMYTEALPPDQPLALYFYRCTWINVIFWGVGYLLAAFLPAARLPVLAAGALGKTAYFLACLALYLTGVGRAGLLTAGILDVGLGLGFAWVLLADRRRQGEDIRV